MMVLLAPPQASALFFIHLTLLRQAIIGIVVCGTMACTKLPIHAIQVLPEPSGVSWEELGARVHGLAAEGHTHVRINRFHFHILDYAHTYSDDAIANGTTLYASPYSINHLTDLLIQEQATDIVVNIGADVDALTAMTLVDRLRKRWTGRIGLRADLTRRDICEVIIVCRSGFHARERSRS